VVLSPVTGLQFPKQVPNPCRGRRDYPGAPFRRLLQLRLRARTGTTLLIRTSPSR
jgi:hypothetical protein